MPVIAFPTSPALRLKRQDFGQRRFDLNFAAGDAGVQQTRILAPPRWMCTLVGDEFNSATEAAAWRVLIMALRGRVNQLEVYDQLNPAPLGTARGTWTANGGAAVGATSIAVSCGVGQAGKTLLKGDWFGVNQSSTNRQLLQLQADVALDGSGNGTFIFEPALRVAVANTSSVVWDKPTCLMRQVSGDSRWTNTRPFQGGFSLDLLESWE